MQVPPPDVTVVQVFDVTGKSTASDDMTEVIVMFETSVLVMVKVNGLSELALPTAVVLYEWLEGVSVTEPEPNPPHAPIFQAPVGLARLLGETLG